MRAVGSFKGGQRLLLGCWPKSQSRRGHEVVKQVTLQEELGKGHVVLKITQMFGNMTIASSSAGAGAVQGPFRRKTPLAAEIVWNCVVC